MNKFIVLFMTSFHLLKHLKDKIISTFALIQSIFVAFQNNSNKVAIILERHEGRLDESERADKLILNMLEEMKERHEKDNELIHQRVTTLQKKVDTNARFVVGAGAVLATLVAVLQVVPPLLKVLTPQLSSSIIGGTHVERLG